MTTTRVGIWTAGLLLLAMPALQAQERGWVRGTVRGAADGAPIGGAMVRALDVEAGSAVTGSGGGFTLSLTAPSRVVARKIGFAPETLSVALGARDVAFRLREAPVALDPVSVAAEGAYSAASSRAVRDLDIRLRPRESSQELLRLAPGLVIAQHAGGGKAEQIFLRGFDADHGTDVAVSVDGTPVNMVSHAHGQGYADLHFLIPEVIEVGDVRKGPYAAEDGDLATAGAVAFRTYDRLPHATLEARAGSFGTAHGLALLPFGGDATRAGGYLAAAAHYSEGPFDAAQGYRRVNLFGKWTAPLGGGATAIASFSGFDSKWDASGQVPERAVRAGAISRFGAIDATEGGTTHRYEASLGARGETPGGATWEARAYALKYRLRLYSNFTFFLADPERGDGIEQLDDRWGTGFRAAYSRPGRLFGRASRLGLGASLRADFADVGLFRQEERRRFGTLVDDGLDQQHGALWAKQEMQLSRRVRLEVGVRGDLFRFSVDDRLAGTPAELPHGSGTRWTGIVSPKASVAVDVAERTTLFGNVGVGFHSNDARDVILASSGVTVLPRAVGAEIGARHSWGRGSVAASVWGLDLGSELVYVGDEGVTEPSGRTRRIGVDLEARVQFAPWLWADADLNLSRGRFRDEPIGADRIPLAPTLTSTGGLTVRDGGPVSGGLRYRHVGTRPADETATVEARGYTVAEAFASWQVGRLDLVVAVDNLFDTEWNEAQFATTSRLRDEPEPVTELHFTPGAGRSAQIGVAWRW